ncbi:MAG: methyl-accepting chemotaxis protein [Nevskiaceae bacterium]
MNVGTKIGLGFGVTLAIFVVVGAISYRSTVALIEASDARKQSYGVLISLGRVWSLVQDAGLGQRGYMLTGDESYLEPYQSSAAQIDAALRELDQLATDPRSRRHLDSLLPLVRQRMDFAREAIELRRTQGVAAAVRLMTSEGKALVDRIRTVASELRNVEEALLAERTDEANTDAERTEATIVWGTLVALALAALAGLVITRNIAGPLAELTGVAERVTAGDLAVKVPVAPRRDEVGVLALAFERMTQALRAMAVVAGQIAAGDLRPTVAPQSADDMLGNALAQMIRNLREQTRQLIEGANVLGSAASEIVASTTQLAASAGESAAAVSETMTTVEEVRQTAQVANQKARQVSDSAQKAAQSSQSGRQSAEDAGAGMERIRQQMEAIAASMVRLSEQSQAIGLIIATVEDLAAQSNLLAVNAAMEAARAGEPGQGFGVVAQEVKSLAEQSRQATGQVRTILGDIQKATAAAVMATEQGGRAVEAGARQTEVAGASIQALSASVNEAAQAATQIAASSQQQMVGVGQVAAAMEGIRQASAQNVAGAQQLETAARNLNELGQRLKQMVLQYQV